MRCEGAADIGTEFANGNFVPRFTSWYEAQRTASFLRAVVCRLRGEGAGRAKPSHCDFVLRALAA